MSLLTDLDAFYLEHRLCGELEGEVTEEGARVVVACCCGALLARRVSSLPGPSVAEP